MKEWVALLVALSVLCFFLHAVGLRLSVSLVWLGVAFLVAGVYLIPVVNVALS
jgi:uncharacterized membrane protein